MPLPDFRVAIVGADGTDSASQPVAGGVADNAVDSGNPVKVGGRVDTTLDTYADGDRADLSMTSRGLARVLVSATNVAGVDAVNNGNLQTFSNEAGGASTMFPVGIVGHNYNGTSWDRNRSIQGVATTGVGAAAVVAAPVTAAAAAITPVVTSAVASSLVLKASAGNFYGANVTAGASAGYVMLFNAAAAPADGAVTPIKTWALAANATLDVRYNVPIRCGTGITLVFSTTGPFTQTLSATAFISGEAV